MKPADLTILSKVSNPNDKIRQIVGGDSGEGGLFGRKSRLESLGVGLVGHSF